MKTVTAALMTEHVFLAIQHLISGSRLFRHPNTQAQKKESVRNLHMDFVLTQKANSRETTHDTHTATSYCKHLTANDTSFKMVVFSLQTINVPLRKKGLTFSPCLSEFDSSQIY